MTGAAWTDEYSSSKPQNPVSTGWAVKLALVLAGSLLILLIAGELAFSNVRNRGHHHLSIDDGVASVDVESIAMGVDGKLWIGHPKSLSQYTLLRYRDTLTRFYPRKYVLDTTGIEHFAYAPNGEIWASDKSPLLLNHFDGSRWRQIPLVAKLSSELRAMTAAPNGDLWLITNEEMALFNGDTWQLFPFPEGLVAGGSAAAASAAGGVWFAGRELRSESAAHSLVHFDGQKWEIFADDVGLPGAVNTINVDDAGTVWIGTQYGLFRYDGQQWQRFTSEDGLLANQVLSIAFGLDGLVWAGTEKGISAYDGQTWRSLVPLTPNCWADELAVDEDDTIYFVVKHCSKLFGLDRAREDGLRFYDRRRLLVPTELINEWHSLRIVLTSLLILCLGYIGQQRSEIPIRSRLKVGVGVSALVCAMVMIAASLLSSMFFGPCQTDRLLFMVPAWFAASALSAAAGLFVGYVQRDDTTTTALTAVAAALFFGGYIGYQVAALACRAI